MQHLCRFWITLVCFYALPLSAQEGIIATGGDVMGVGGSLSFSVGQVTDAYSNGPAGSINEGIQQVYDGMMVGTADYPVPFRFSLYPNPASTEIILELRAPLIFSKEQGFSYVLTDLTGRPLLSGTILENLTRVPITHLSQGLYWLTLYADSKVITTFKIIKA
jgi:hypothetical protein